MSSDGEVQGVGLLIAADPSSGRLVVLAPIQGGPADRAGILPGDEVAHPAITWFHMAVTVRDGRAKGLICRACGGCWPQPCALPQRRCSR